MVKTTIFLLMSSPEGGGDGFSSQMMLFGAMFLIIYLFFIRPQSKKAKQQKEFIHELDKGDRVVISSGIHGKIVKVDETTLLIEVDNNTKLKVEKSAVSLELSKALNEKKTEKADKQ
ncbi:MAG: preprotein translocase subunit YajC [Bacteroidetes bacterium]|nr:preprotein translocase subunit YajC [Bacteroidota bacterium]